MVEMARLLNVDYETYRKYEERTCLPHRYIPLFCELCGITTCDLFGLKGRRRRPTRPETPER